MAKQIPLEERVSIGGRMRITREALGLSQGDLGEILGVNGNAVSQYESGERVINHITLRRWCIKDKITYEWIYDGNPDGLPHGLAVKVTTGAATSTPNPPSSASRAKQKAAK